ncbi:hypothetical protein [Dactylosporangium sp. NPDC050588]|uniref:hypothetical protein n=1 Tax=Dactylosporangium sp. NPDC050588 TaxID=3157211 RepID=UPI0033D1D418
MIIAITYQSAPRRMAADRRLGSCAMIPDVLLTNELGATRALAAAMNRTPTLARDGLRRDGRPRDCAAADRTP